VEIKSVFVHKLSPQEPSRVPRTNRRLVLFVCQTSSVRRKCNVDGCIDDLCSFHTQHMCFVNADIFASSWSVDDRIHKRFVSSAFFHII